MVRMKIVLVHDFSDCWGKVSSLTDTFSFNLLSNHLFNLDYMELFDTEYSIKNKVKSHQC